MQPRMNAEPRSESRSGSNAQSNKQKLSKMPLCKQFVDDVRAAFGDPVAISARENGLTVEWRK